MVILRLVIKHWKLGLIILVVIALIYYQQRAQYFERENSRNEKDLKVVTGIVTGEKLQTKFYKNKLGDQVAKTQKAELSRQAMESLMKSKELEWAKSSNAKTKQIDALTTTIATISLGSLPVITTVEPCPDSLTTYKLEYHDSLNNISIKAIAPIVLDIEVLLHELDIWERKQWPRITLGKKTIGPRIGKKEWFKEITTPNKLVNLNSQVIYTVRKKRKGD